MLSKGLRCPTLHPQSFAEGKDPGVTLLPHSHKHSAYRLFQVIRRIKTHPNPELLCSKSIYNFISPLPGGKSGFQVGKLRGEGMPLGQWPAASLLASACGQGWGEFLEMGASRPSGGTAPYVLSVCGPRLCHWRESPCERKPHLEYQSAMIQVW